MDIGVSYKRDIALILAAVGIAYSTTLAFGFVMDDFGVVVNNPLIKSPANIPGIFTSSYWDSDSYTASLYRPLDILSFMAEYTLAGLRPLIYHLDNVILHFFCSVLVYMLAREILGGGGRAPLFAGLLFATHPLHSEAVAWISCRGELLSGMFTLTAVLTFVKSRRGVPRWAYVSYVAFFLGLLSKESAIVAPLLAALYVAVYELPQRKPGIVKKSFLRLSPYVLVFALYLSMRVAVVGLAPDVNDEVFDGVSGYGKLLTMCAALTEYLRLHVLPTGMKADYVFPPPQSMFDAKVLFPLALIALFVLLIPRLVKGKRPGLFFSGWFIAASLPFMNIMPAGFIMADRVMYLPSAGICVILGMVAARAGDSVSPRAATATVLVSVALLVGLTLNQDRIWKDQGAYVDSFIGMLDRDLARYPDYPPLLRSRARVLARFRGNSPGADEAIRKAAALAPKDDPETHSMLADVYFRAHDYDKALAESLAAAKLSDSPNDYYFSGLILAKLGRRDQALGMVSEAIKRRPTKDAYFMLRGSILLEKGDNKAAAEAFDVATRLNPEGYDAWLERGIALNSTGQLEVGIESIKRAVGLRPDIPDLHYFLAVAYLDAGRRDEGEHELREALRLKPDYKEAGDLLKRIAK